MALAVLLLLGLFWSLVHSQRAPYASFMGQTMANHSYVDLSLVRRPEDGGEGVQCITDLNTCCTNVDGSHRGDWYFPNGTRLPIPTYGDTYEFRAAQRVDLRRRNNVNSPVGIYRCDIPTNVVHDDTDISVRDTVYVGLYTASGGDVTIPGGVTYDFNTQTLTCISTGGPATTVTWTRDSTTVTQGTQTVFNDPVTAQYTHTLNVAGGLPGLYTCTVTNNKPSNASARITLPDKPEEVRFLPVNATAVRISWTGSVHLPTSIIYTVYCSTIIIIQYERVYSPGVTFADIVLEDDITLTDIYVHNFTLHYIIPDDVIPNQTVAIFTFDKGVFQIQFGPFYYCLDSVFKKIARAIEEQLQLYLIVIIRKSCPECYSLTRTFLRPGLFLCHGNPTKTTYRTTLVNPFPTTNSTHMVGIIQSWVSTGPSLVLDGLLVRVSPSCPTSISSLDEEECETGTRYDPGLGDRITQTLNVCALRNLGEDVCRLGGC